VDVDRRQLVYPSLKNVSVFMDQAKLAPVGWRGEKPEEERFPPGHGTSHVEVTLVDVARENRATGNVEPPAAIPLR
jgi:hypothetical protein